MVGLPRLFQTFDAGSIQPSGCLESGLVAGEGREGVISPQKVREGVVSEAGEECVGDVVEG